MLDKNFFVDVLRQGLDNDTITNVTIISQHPAVEMGANFLSELWRFVIGYAYEEQEKGIFVKKDISLIVKLEPNEGPAVDLIKDQKIFNTEQNIFKHILPEIEKIVGKRFGPKCFYASQSMNVIVLEDLTPLGYKPKDRQLGISMSYMLKVLDTIAEFHAGSVCQYEQIPDMMKSFTDGIFTGRTPIHMFRVLKSTLQMVCDEIRNWPDQKYSRIADKLATLQSTFVEDVIKATGYDNNEFCVLNHGDLWINNMMFREDINGEPLDLMLIDYQMSVYSSPAIDLIYILSICPAADLKATRDDFFLEHYLGALKKTMIRLNCKTRSPTIIDLKKSMLKRRMWAVMAGLTLWPRMIADCSEIESFDGLLRNGETKMKIFKNPTATTALKVVLPLMEERGYLD